MLTGPKDQDGLAGRQAELVAALAAGGDPPEGFDADDLGAAARSIALKRLREARLSWPTLCRKLDPQIDARFLAYAAARPAPPGGGIADALAFARDLHRRRELPESARIELLAFEARWRVRDGRALPRRAPVLRVAALRRSRRLVAVLRAPRVGERWLELHLP